MELVSLDLLERRSAFPISSYTACACAHSSRKVVVYACGLVCHCVCGVFLSYRMFPPLQGEDGEAGDPGSAGEPGIAVSHVASFLLPLSQNHILSLRPFIDCHFVCWCPRVLKAMWGRRVTLALLVQQGLQDPEEHQERTDPKATL